MRAAEESTDLDDIGYVSTRAVRVETTPPQAVLVDGEAVGETPVTVEIVPGALTLVAPPAPAPADEPHAVKLAGLPGLSVERG